MRGLLLSLLAAAPVAAQCHEPQLGPAIGTGDDVVLPMQALGFAFPFAGATWTHVHPCTNGFVYLSNAGVPAAGGALCCVGSTTQLVAGGPKIAPWWSDLDVVAGVGAVHFQALPGKAVVTWRDAYEHQDTTPFSFQLQLLATGEVRLTWDHRCAVRTPGDFLVGLSPGGGAPVPPPSDFSGVGSVAANTVCELFDNGTRPFDLAGRTLTLVPTSPGWFWVDGPCSASHQAYGQGCYRVSDSVYQFTAAPAVSAAALTNRSIALVPTASGLLATNGSPFVPPSPSAIALPLADDGETTTPALAVPFPYPGGVVTALTVCSNGFVSVASGNGTSYAPDTGAMLGNPRTAWYAWHDYDPTAPGSGAVKFEQAGGIATITWDGVYNYGGTSPADATRLQFRFDAATGTVTIAFQNVSANAHPNAFAAGQPHLVGFSPGGPSLDPGSISFATGLPVATVHGQLLPLALGASPAPVSTATGGAVVTYTVANVPETAPGSGQRIAVYAASFGTLGPGGLDLGFLGAPGCALQLPTTDYSRLLAGTTPALAFAVQFPAGIPPGFVFHSQAAALLAPGSLPNGQNALGLLTSNGLASVVGGW